MISLCLLLCSTLYIEAPIAPPAKPVIEPLTFDFVKWYFCFKVVGTLFAANCFTCEPMSLTSETVIKFNNSFLYIMNAIDMAIEIKAAVVIESVLEYDKLNVFNNTANITVTTALFNIKLPRFEMYSLNFILPCGNSAYNNISGKNTMLKENINEASIFAFPKPIIAIETTID